VTPPAHGRLRRARFMRISGGGALMVVSGQSPGGPTCREDVAATSFRCTCPPGQSATKRRTP
jgi:hypothetical protein